MAGKGFSVMRGTYNARLEVLGAFTDRVEGAAKAASIASASSPASKETESLSEGPFASTRQEDRRKNLGPIEEIATPWDSITEAMLDSLPHLNDFVVWNFQRRILQEDLLESVKFDSDESELEAERQRELSSPFGFVKRLMMEVDEENERANEEEDDIAGAEGVGAM